MHFRQGGAFAERPRSALSQDNLTPDKSTCPLCRLDFTGGLISSADPQTPGRAMYSNACIFMFGASAKPFDESTGFDTVNMVVETEEGHTVTLERQLDKSVTQVTSTVRGVENGKYGGQKSKKKLSDLWLSQLAIRTDINHLEQCTGDKLQWSQHHPIHHGRERRALRILDGGSQLNRGA